MAGALCLALASCDASAVIDSDANDTNALPFARLSRGAVILVPATGFCIDKRSLRPSFALMARCDTLGGTSSFGAPLAIITAASVSQSVTNRTDAAFGTQGETILARRQSGDLTLIKVKGAPPSPDLKDEFWRAIGRIGDQLVGLAIYEAADGEALGDDAPDLLAQTMRRTQAQTTQQARVVQDNSATAVSKPAAN